MVPIFTNVIFDTSQAHANKAFAHMFDWLDATLEVVKATRIPCLYCALIRMNCGQIR